MKKRCFLFFLAALQIILLGCSATRPHDFSSSAVPADDFINGKVAIEQPKFQKYTQFPLHEFLKGMKPGKWQKVSDAQWLYNMKNDKYDIYVLFVKHPIRQDSIMFQRVIINGKDVPADGLLTLFNHTLSEADRDAMKSNDVSTDGVLTLFNSHSPEARDVLPEKSIDHAPQKAAAEPAAAIEVPNKAAAVQVVKERSTIPTATPAVSKTPAEAPREGSVAEKAAAPAKTEAQALAEPAPEIPATETKPSQPATPDSTTTPAATTPVAAEEETAATQKVKVIGNRDTKRYHLPGMKYYKSVKAYHRIEFESEAAAIKAGYHKAPR